MCGIQAGSNPGRNSKRRESRGGIERRPHTRSTIAGRGGGVGGHRVAQDQVDELLRLGPRHEARRAPDQYGAFRAQACGDPRDTLIPPTFPTWFRRTTSVHVLGSCETLLSLAALGAGWLGRRRLYGKERDLSAGAGPAPTAPIPALPPPTSAHSPGGLMERCAVLETVLHFGW